MTDQPDYAEIIAKLKTTPLRKYHPEGTHQQKAALEKALAQQTDHEPTAPATYVASKPTKRER